MLKKFCIPSLRVRNDPVKSTLQRLLLIPNLRSAIRRNGIISSNVLSFLARPVRCLKISRRAIFDHHFKRDCKHG